MKKPQGLYANINAKRKRIEKGSKERMRKVGEEGAPTEQDFIDSAKTAKKFNPKAIAKLKSKLKK